MFYLHCKCHIGLVVILLSHIWKSLNASADLDVEFEEEASVMPLMSAAKVWLDLESTVVDENVFKSISNLLFIQVNL